MTGGSLCVLTFDLPLLPSSSPTDESRRSFSEGGCLSSSLARRSLARRRLTSVLKRRSPSFARLVTRYMSPVTSFLEPATHSAFQFQIGLAEFFGEICFFAQDHAVMQDQGERNDEQQRDPVVQKKAKRDLN